MKKPSNFIIGATTAAAIVAPFAPKTVNITVGDVSSIVAEAQSCTLVSTIIDDHGQRFCEYRCGTRLRIMPESGGSCENPINEKLIK
jgi:hypothetical protein